MELNIVKKIRDRQNILATDLTNIVSDPKRCRIYALQMAQLCRKHGGIGLAANQVGLRENLFLIMPSAKLLPGKSPELCINPRYTPTPDAVQYKASEGCLSLEKGKQYPVMRWNRIVATWTNVQGHEVTRTLSLLAAQVFQHEYDHLLGITLEESQVAKAIPTT